LGLFDRQANVAYAHIPFAENDSAAHRNLALDVARKSMVLLKNDNAALPLSPNVKTIAVIGPNAATLAALEGNYNGVPSHPVLPLDGLEQEFAGRAKILYAQGSPYVEGVPLPVPRTAFRAGPGEAKIGLAAEYFDNSDFRGKPVLKRTDPQIDFDWNSASPATGIPANEFGVRWTGTIRVPKAGDYSFDVSFAHCYPCFSRESYAILVDGRRIAAFATDEQKGFHASTNASVAFHFADTNPHAIRVDYSHHSRLFGAGISLNWEPPPGSLFPDAVAAAKQADVVVAFVGLSPELEGEEMPVHVEGFAGGDRTKIDLPETQQQMLRAVAAAGKPLIVVLMNGSALAANWIQQHASAVLEAWYPGEAGGQAIAETLSGKNNPAGRLPVTFYASLDQIPPFTDYAMNGRTYRFFRGEPLYRFGYGLSYTHFSYSDLHLSTENLTAGDTLVVEVDVRNSGPIAGDEVAELYLIPPKREQGPMLALRAFERVSLSSSESRHLRFELSPRQLSEVDRDGSRTVQAGEYTITVGGGQPLAGFNGLTARLVVTGTLAMPQ
jgi:beta-glucosidase